MFFVIILMTRGTNHGLDWDLKLNVLVRIGKKLFRTDFRNKSSLSNSDSASLAASTSHAEKISAADEENVSRFLPLKYWKDLRI